MLADPYADDAAINDEAVDKQASMLGNLTLDVSSNNGKYLQVNAQPWL